MTASSRSASREPSCCRATSSSRRRDWTPRAPPHRGRARRRRAESSGIVRCARDTTSRHAARAAPRSSSLNRRREPRRPATRGPRRHRGRADPHRRGPSSRLRASSPRVRTRPRPRRPVKSASRWTKNRLALIPPSTRTSGTSTPVSSSAASSRSAPRWAMPSRTARTRWSRVVPRVRPKKAPRAPKSHRGVPSPESAGTKVTPSRGGDRVGRRPRCRRGDEMSPRSAHPLDARAGTKGDALDSPGRHAARAAHDRREASRGVALHRGRCRVGPTMSSIAPVPKVIFAPRSTHDWPKSDAGWSPTSAVIRGAPASAWACRVRPRCRRSRASSPGRARGDERTWASHADSIGCRRVRSRWRSSGRSRTWRRR